MAKILIVEDDINTSHSICEYLKDAGHHVQAAYDGQQALDIIMSISIDAVVLDIMLPKISGLELLEEIRAHSDVPVLMLTAVKDEMTQIISFDRLADDYITKPCSILLLGKRINALLRRVGKANNVNIWTCKDLVVDFTSYMACNANGKIDIVQKELQVLKVLIDNQGLVLTREQIIDDIWGLESPESDRTIDLYISRLRIKLGLDCIKTVKGIGYRFEAVE